MFSKQEGHYSFNCEQELFLNTRPHQTVWIESKLRSPANPGTYRAVFRLHHSGNVVFGEEAKLHVVVVQKEKDPVLNNKPQL